MRCGCDRQSSHTRRSSAAVALRCIRAVKQISALLSPLGWRRRPACRPLKTHARIRLLDAVYVCMLWGFVGAGIDCRGATPAPAWRRRAYAPPFCLADGGMLGHVHFCGLIAPLIIASQSPNTLWKFIPNSPPCAAISANSRLRMRKRERKEKGPS
jgi:hypothetical protein